MDVFVRVVLRRLDAFCLSYRHLQAMYTCSNSLAGELNASNLQEDLVRKWAGHGVGLSQPRWDVFEPSTSSSCEA